MAMERFITQIFVYCLVVYLLGFRYFCKKGMELFPNSAPYVYVLLNIDFRVNQDNGF